MATILPFRAFRPIRGRELEVAAPPYDVVTTEEARRLAEGKPYSFLHVTRPEIDLPEGTDLYSPEVYAKAAENLRRLLSDGVVIQDESESLYLYRQQMGDHVQTGVVGLCSVKEYEADLIKKHEHTRKAKEDDRTRHVAAVKGNPEPVFLMYRARKEIDQLVDTLVREMEPIVDVVTPDEVRQTIWRVTDEERVASLHEAFEMVEALYVADGHHRTAANVRYAQKMRSKVQQRTGREPWEYFMAVVFPHNQLQILGYHRVVRDLGGVTPDRFLEKVYERFDVSETDSGEPDGPGVFGMYLNGRWYRLTPRPGTVLQGDPVKSLDCSVLQENLLEPVLGIADPRTDKRIDFVGGIKGVSELERLCDSGEYALAFALYPTKVEQVMEVADAGKVMPPKSTWFEPKLKSGLFFRLF